MKYTPAPIELKCGCVIEGDSNQLLNACPEMARECIRHNVKAVCQKDYASYCRTHFTAGVLFHTVPDNEWERIVTKIEQVC